jgi:hypothetical protein
MKQSKLITVPIKARSSKKHPEVHLAYITDKEQDLLIKKDLYNSLKGKPNRGPGGLPSLEGDFGSPTGDKYEPAGPDKYTGPKATGEGGQKYTRTSTAKTTDGTSSAKNFGLATSIAKGNIWTTALNLLTRPFKKKGPTKTEMTAASEDAYKTKSMSYYKDKFNPPPRNGAGNRPLTTLVTQSVVTSPTADKAHEWDFKAYDNKQASAPSNVYDYNKAPYAKKGKLIRKYATGQEIKNFSKGKRFGPPPLKGPDPQGLQVILENSDYFKKLIG